MRNHFSSLGSEEDELELKHEIIKRLIFGKQFPVLMALSCKYSGGVIEPEDVIQEIALYLLKKDVAFLLELEKKGIAGVFVLIKNKVIDLIRKKRIREKHTRAYCMLSGADDHLAHETKSEQIGLINLVSKKLKTRDQQIVQLVLAGYNNREISKIIGVNPKTVSTRKARSILKIRRIFYN